jgi:hypothetical protein
MTTEQQLQPAPNRSWFGVLVGLGALGVTVLATVVAGISLDNALSYGRLRDRTIWGILLMAVGAVAPVVAVFVLVRCRRIVQRVVERRWGAVALFPGSFVALWGLVVLGYAVLEDVWQTPIIPYTPKFVVQFGPDGNAGFVTIGNFGGGSEGRSESFANGVHDRDITFEYRVHPDASGKSAVTFEGGLKPPGAVRAELYGTLVLQVKVRMRVEGLSGAALTINDQPREFPVDLEPGTYRIRIEGTPHRE